MRRNKITSWILLVAMLFTVMPTSVVFAAPTWAEADCPELKITFFTQDSSRTEGDDLVKNAEDAFELGAGGKYDPVAGFGEDDYSWKLADTKAVTTPATRRQGVTVFASAKNGGSFGTKHVLNDGAVQYTYLNLNKQPLVENADGTMSTADPADEIVWYDYNALDASSESLLEFNQSEHRLEKVRATNQQVAEDAITTVNVWNIIRSDFNGYIRIKVTDSNGYSTYQDSLFIADGKYPTISVVSSTERTAVGEVGKVTKDTKIAGRIYRNATDGIREEIEVVGNNWFGIADADMLKDITETYATNIEYWTNEDITLSIVAKDADISAELESLEWKVYNIKTNIALAEDASTPIVKGKIVLDDYVLGVNDDAKKVIDASDYLPGNSKGYVPQISNADLIIPKSAEGQNILVVTAKDRAGLTITNYYYFFIDSNAPVAEFTLSKTDKNVVQLFSDADIVTNRELALDMGNSYDTTTTAALISNLKEIDKNGANVMYQYRLLNTNPASVGDATDNIPAGYSKTAPANTNLTYGEWLVWTGSADLEAALTPIIDEEFDGLVQVRVQDKAGNWSDVVSVTENGEETIITDNTNAEIETKIYANDGDAATVAEIEAGTAANILDGTDRDTVTEAGDNENEEILTITGDKMPWINDSAVLEVVVKDEDLVNAIRSSGLSKGEIVVDAVYHDKNETKKAKIWKNDGTFDEFEDTITIDADNLYPVSGDNDKNLKFFVEFDGTGVADITVSIKDQADVNDNDDFTVIYKLQLKVDKINPYFEFKGYDMTDAAQADLLKPNTTTSIVDYELRDMPWGPNSQVLEVNVKDDDITPVQSKVNNVKFNSNKDVTLYAFDETAGEFVEIKDYTAGADLVIDLADCKELANADYEENPGYKFYLVYDGTGVAKIEFYADDVAGNVRDYPSAQATPVEYDAKLRVDKINPEIKNLKLVQQATDVNDGFMLFTVNQTQVDVNTRKQMTLSFEIDDAIDTAEQAGPNIQNEEFADIDLMDVYEKYVESDKTHLYDDEAVTYATDDSNDEAIDPNIDYILIPVEIGAVNGLGGEMVLPAADDNAAIEAWVNDWITKWDAEGIKVEWQNKAWTDGAIVVPDEFQGAIVVRTIDRVGNVDYAAPITFVAESRDPLIDFDPQNGYIWSQNNYGWSKRDYDYVEIRVKDTNVEKVDAWLENVFIQVTDLEGNDISTKNTVKYAYPQIHADDPVDEVNPSGYTYVGLDEFTAEALYGYDVISKDGLVEKLARDEEGYIHLGFVRVEESAQIKVTIFDKAKYNDAEYTGNKTTGIWTSRIDRVAPIVTEFDLVPLYEGKKPEDNNNNFALKIAAEDALSGLAPYITDAEYNVYTPENKPETGVFAPGVDTSYLYRILDDTDTEIERYESGTFNKRQYELPGLQYALIPRNGFLDDVDPWDFETAPDTTYDANGYNGEMGKPYVWHNYVDETVPVLPENFDGFIVVRAIDKAGNITVIGYSTILDVEADDDWNNETQFIQVRTDKKWDDGAVVNVEYYGNNNLLFPADMRKDLSNSLNNGEGAIIEVAEEGITNVVITATEEFVAPKTEKAKADDEAQKRDSDWEGEMYLGNLTATGYNDWKFQVVDVKIDKTNPEFGFKIVDENGNIVTDEAVKGALKVKLTEIFDPIPNINENDPLPETKDEWYYASHIPSDIAKVEWCAVPEGSDEEKWEDANDWKNLELGVFDATDFTGTIKVRVTDNAGNVAEKSQRINVDGVEALINLSKSHDDIYSLEPVDVFVTVTENAEFSDISEVTYVVTDEDGNIVEEDKLTLIGGTVSVDREGTSTVTVTATTKAGVQASESIEVKIDMSVPTFEMDVVDSFDSVKDRATNEAVTIKAIDVADAISGVKVVEYAVIPEGSSEVNYKEMTLNGDIYEAPFDVADAFTGTVNVRVTDVAGHITVKSMKIHIDKKAPIVVISNPTNENDYSTENVDVVVNVTADAEYSDVKAVTYTVNGVDMGALALNGGTISITEEGESVIKVTAVTKANVSYPATTTVYIDKTAPEFDLSVEDSNGSVEGRFTKEAVTIKAENIVENGSDIKAVEYAVIPEGSLEENYKTLDAAGATFNADAFTGTVKVRVTDNAGNVTVKSMRINIDNVAPIIVITNETDANNYSTKSVEVFVTVTENAEFSDVAEVTYKAGNATGTLALTGGTITVAEEGITTVVVTAKTKAGAEETAETIVYIDKTAPEFTLSVKDSKGSVEGRFTKESVTIKAENIVENGSQVKAVEYAVVPEGSLEENYKTLAAAGAAFNADAFTGTVKVRVTDNAGNVTVKSMRINIDNVAPVISASKSYETTCASGPVEVYVTVSETAEFSDVAKVTYTVDGGAAKNLPLIGGTISIDKEGQSVIKITATNKAGVSVTETVNVNIHHNKLAMPVIEGVQPGGWKTSNSKVTVTYAGSETVYYSLNGSDWKVLPADKKITLVKGANKILLQARSTTCACVSDINTYDINFDAGNPKAK